MNALEILKSINKGRKIQKSDYLKAYDVRKVDGYIRIRRTDGKYSYVTPENYEKIKKYIITIKESELKPMETFYKNMQIAFNNAVEAGLGEKEISECFVNALSMTDKL